MVGAGTGDRGAAVAAASAGKAARGGGGSLAGGGGAVPGSCRAGADDRGVHRGHAGTRGAGQPRGHCGGRGSDSGGGGLMQVPKKMPHWNGMHSPCFGSTVDSAPAVPLAGQAFSDGVAVVWRHVLGGLTNWRLHIKTASAGGTLAARYIRAGYDGSASGEYLEAGNPTNVTVVAGTANVMPVTQHFGEHAIEFT